MNIKVFNTNVFEEKTKDFLTFLEVEKNASQHTLRAYASDLRQFSQFWQKILTQEPVMADSFGLIARRFVVSLFYQKLSKPSLARKLSTMRSFQDFLKKQGISLNIDIKAPRLDKKLPVTLSVDEISYLLDSLKPQDLPTKYPYRDKAIFEIIYATGIRCSEVIIIKNTDLDFDNKTIKIMGKGKKERMVLFGTKAKESLIKYLEHERPLLTTQTEQNFIFLNKNGTQLTTRTIQRIFEMFRRLLKVNRKLTPHKIRHSFATHLLCEGVDLRIIQELLGHKTIATTEIYTHVTNQQLARMCDEKHPLNKLSLINMKEKK